MRLFSAYVWDEYMARRRCRYCVWMSFIAKPLLPWALLEKHSSSTKIVTLLYVRYDDVMVYETVNTQNAQNRIINLQPRIISSCVLAVSILHQIRPPLTNSGIVAMEHVRVWSVHKLVGCNTWLEHHFSSAAASGVALELNLEHHDPSCKMATIDSYWPRKVVIGTLTSWSANGKLLRQPSLEEPPP